MTEPTHGTPVGTTNAGPLAVVDRAGTLVAVDGAWRLDWWVGADDRWHLAAEESAVRQRLVDAMPVVETAMRVPTGDTVARAYGARIGGLADDLTPRKTLRVTATGLDGSVRTFDVICRLDGPIEVDYYRQGGILPAVLRRLADA